MRRARPPCARCWTSEDWELQAEPVASKALQELATGAWTLVIANIGMTGLAGPLYTTLKELALAPAIGSRQEPACGCSSWSRKMRAAGAIDARKRASALRAEAVQSARTSRKSQRSADGDRGHRHSHPQGARARAPRQSQARARGVRLPPAAIPGCSRAARITR